MSTINRTAHGLTAGQRVVFRDIIAGTNLLANGGGETGAVGSPAPSWTLGAGSPLNVASDQFFSGLKSLKIINSPAADSYSYQDVAVVAGTTYVLFGRIKTSILPPGDPGWGAVLNLDSLTAGNITVLSRIGDSPSFSTVPDVFAGDVGVTADGSAHDWAPVSTRVQAASSGTVRIYCQLGYAGAQSGTAWFDDVSFGAEVASGLDPDVVYFVLAAGLTANTFQVSETDGGTPITLSAAIASMSMQVVPETTDTDASTATYVPVTDIADPQAPPTATPPASAPTVSSALVSGIVRLVVTLNDVAEVKVRVWEVQITSKLNAGNADWTSPSIFNMPENSTELSIPALGSTQYTARVRAIDVYGNFGTFSSEVSHTTTAGSDALNAALAGLANDIPDKLITAVKIDDNAIQARHVSANSITANALAATIILTSLLKTADSGRRVEVDGAGIRLLDTDGSLLVNIPTNGDPVYIKGQVNADSLISQTAAEFRGSVSLASGAIMSLQNGVNNPANQPGVSASVDALGLTSTPPNLGYGIGYDSAGGAGGATPSYWLGADASTSEYMAHEYNASTGALIRSITKTGSIVTHTATLGSTAHVSDSAQATSGGTDSQVATPLTMPSGLDNIIITKVAAYMAGYGGACNTKLAVWTPAGTLLKETASFTATSQALGTGNSALYNKSLTSPLTGVVAGGVYRIGWLRTSTADGFQWDRDDGSSKTTYRGDGEDGDLTSVSTDSGHKPNVWITYTYTTDDRLEGTVNGKIIGVARQGAYIWCLDSGGFLYRYNQSNLTFVDKFDLSTRVTGTKANAGLFYDSVAGVLVITTATGVSGADKTRFVKVTTAGAFSANLDDTTLAVNGSAHTFRGGARVNDALNGSTDEYWVPINTTLAQQVYAFNASTGANVANRSFGTFYTVNDGLTYDGTQFRGWALSSPTTIWKFSGWDWTTASSIYWFGYTWYDSNATGGTHETGISPRTGIALRRRERVLVWNAAIPVGGVDDPNNMRMYALPNASDPGTGASYKLQVTDAATSRYLTDYNSGGAANPASNGFAVGTPAELKSNTLGWSFKGDGSVILPKDTWITSNDNVFRFYFANGSRTYLDSAAGYEFRNNAGGAISILKDGGHWMKGGTVFPTADRATNDTYYRTDLGMEFYWDGARWLSTQVFTQSLNQVRTVPIPFSVTQANATEAPMPSLLGGSDIYVVNHKVSFFVASGGTALGASHKWVVTLDKIDSANANTTIGTTNIDSGASATYRSIETAINALHGAFFIWRANFTKTGSPGNLTVNSVLSYRIVAT